MSNRISGILLLTLVALCVIIVVEARSGVPSAERLRASEDPAVDTSSAGPVRLSLPPLAVLSETVERPLFSESRQPPQDDGNDAPVSPSAVAAGPAANFSISAIMITNKERAVLLIDPQSGKLTRVEEGDTIAGWRLERVEDDRAVFSRDGENREAVLRTFGPPPAPRPRRSLPSVRGIKQPERALRQPAEAARLRALDSRQEPDSER